MKDLTRRQGFAGQHIVVVPDPVRAAARRHALLRGLHVTDAGYFPCAVGHCIERPAGAATTLVILCMKGAGWFTLGGERADVVRGDLVWLPAGRPHAYGSAEDAWTIAWAHFSGDEVSSWRRHVEAGDSAREAIVRLPVDRLDEIALDRVYAALERGYAVRHQVSAAAALRCSLSAAAEVAHGSKHARSAQDRVASSIDVLRRDWQRAHRLEELATAAGVSVTHYSAIFRRQTGFAPIDFVIRLRIQHACRLLDTTRQSVQEIAGQVGYSDPYYFTRCFTRVMGCAPREYRKVQKG